MSAREDTLRSGQALAQAVAVLLLAIALGGGFVACASMRIQPGDLPAEPIALLHWEDKAAQKRTEAFGKVSEAPPLPRSELDPARQDEAQVRAYLRADEILQIRKETGKYPGRLMLLHPRTEEMVAVEEAPRDAIPLAWSPDRERLRRVIVAARSSSTRSTSNAGICRR